ncbi:hypothetical protein ACR3K2_13320 [Cryptosporidium serpentis]
MASCIECGSYVAELYKEYSSQNIRLSVCGMCGQIADKYIEFNRLNIIIALMLHKPQAYRHVLFNRPLLVGKENTLNFLKYFCAAVIFEAHINFYSLGFKQYAATSSFVAWIRNYSDFFSISFFRNILDLVLFWFNILVFYIKDEYAILSSTIAEYYKFGDNHLKYWHKVVLKCCTSVLKRVFRSNESALYHVLNVTSQSSIRSIYLSFQLWTVLSSMIRVSSYLLTIHTAMKIYFKISPVKHKGINQFIIEYRCLTITILIYIFGKLIIISMLIWDKNMNLRLLIEIFTTTANATSLHVCLNTNSMVFPLAIAYLADCAKLLI